MNKTIPLCQAVVLASLIFAGAFPSRVVAQTDVAYPSDAGVLNVTNYGVVSGSTNDQTVEFQNAIAAALNGKYRYGGMVILYIPNGTYMLSNTLQNRTTNAFSDGWAAGLYLQGQSQTGTVLKLINSTPAFSNAATPKAVIQTGSENPYTNGSKANTALAWTNSTGTNGTVTVTCPSHGYVSGQSIDIVGGYPTGYNEEYAPITVLNSNTFTYPHSGTLTTPALTNGTSASYTPGEGNQAFRHYIRNLTIDVGTNNPGAVGIDYLVNNRGGIYNVTVKSSDSNYVGYTGIMMDRNYPGPGILKNVTVTGFTTGISMRSASEYGMTFDNITLGHQTGYGIDDHSNTMAIDGLTSTDAVPVIYDETTTAHLTLLNGTFTGGMGSNNAITGSGAAYIRNVKSTGFGNVIDLNGTTVAGNGNTPVTVSEFESKSYMAFADDLLGAVQLPIEETPDYNDTTLSDWTNAASKTNTDYLSSIQAALNSGKPVVYLPQGSYTVSNTIHVPNSVQKFIGCCAILGTNSSFPVGSPLIEFDGGTNAPFTDIQNIRLNGTIQHNGGSDLALENIDAGSYSNTSSGQGALYTEDTISGAMNINYPQYVWSRQLDIEGLTNTFVANKGGVDWILGFKTENQTTSGSIIDNEDGGWLELLGGFFYNTSSSSPTKPMIINNGSSLTADYIMDAYESKNFLTNVIDTESGVTTNFTNGNVPLYSGATALYSTTSLADYTFAGNSLASTNTTAGMTASSFTSGSGYTNTGFTTTARSVIGAGMTNYTAPQDYSAGEYFSFTMTANSGKTLNLANLLVTLSRGQSSPPACTIYAVPNGGTYNGQPPVLDNVPIDGDTNLEYSADLTDPEYQGISSVTFYIIVDGANQANSTAKDYIGPVQVTGSVQ